MAKSKSRAGRGASRHRYRPSPAAQARTMPRPITLRLSPLPSLISYEDRRTWHPDGPLRSVFAFRRSARRILDRANPMWHARSALHFADPTRVVLCLRRKVRKEVMHALRKTGKRGRGQKPPKRNFYSAIGC